MMEDDLEYAMQLARIGGPYRSWPGSGQITGPYDRPMQPTAQFSDWGLARAVAIILNAIESGDLARSPSAIEQRGE